MVIRARRVAQMLPVLEAVLGSGGGDAEPAPQDPPRAEWQPATENDLALARMREQSATLPEEEPDDVLS